MSYFVSSPLGLRSRAVLALILALAAGLGAAPLSGGESGGSSPAAVCSTFRVRPQDQVWAISTRCLGCPGTSPSEPQWTVWRYEPAGPRWLNATTKEFDDSPPGPITDVYIHGNRIDNSLALRDGLDVYFQLAGKLDDAPPVRMVIWSWPSEKIRGPLRDVRSKAARADTEAVYLGQFLARRKANEKVGLLGYSFGARIAAGALHLLSGDELDGVRLAEVRNAGEKQPQVHLAFWAAAEHDDWLLPGRYHGAALPMGQRWLNTRNCCDPILARYRFLEKCDNPVALGYSGLVGRNLIPAEWNARIEEMDVTHLVGRSHEMQCYLYSLPILDRTRDYLLWHAPAATGQPGELAQAAQRQ